MSLIVLFFLVSCAPPTVVKQIPSFYQSSYVIEQGKLNQSLGVTTALLETKGDVKTGEVVEIKLPAIYYQFGYNPQNNKKEIFQYSISDDFKNATLKSLESILLQKGYNVISSYNNWDVMTYEEKKKVDLLIIPEINVKEKTMTYPNLEGPFKFLFFPLKKGLAGYKGEIGYEGVLTLTIVEPLTREKLWTKSLKFDVEKEQIDVEIEYVEGRDKYQATMLANESLNRARQYAFNKALEKAYANFLTIFKNYLPSGEEAINLAKQARELKTVKRY